MAAPITVSEKDLLALLGIVSGHRKADPGDGLPLTLLEALMAQVPSDSVSFFGLGVSEATVRKHLENIYARLQVSSRTAAVTRAFSGRRPGAEGGTRRRGW